MMSQEEDRNGPWVLPQTVILAFTCQTAIAEAKRQLCALDGRWCNASPDQVVQEIRSNCTIFTGDEGRQIRIAIFGTTQCPTSAPSCLEVPVRYNCVGGQCVAAANGQYETLAQCQAACGPGGGGGDNTMLWVGLGVVALLGVVLVATQPAKKTIVAKVAR